MKEGFDGRRLPIRTLSDCVGISTGSPTIP